MLIKNQVRIFATSRSNFRDIRHYANFRQQKILI